MKVLNEIRIAVIDGKDTQIGEAHLVVTSTPHRRRGVAIQLFVGNSEAPSKVVVVDGDELKAAVENSQRGG